MSPRAPYTSAPARDGSPCSKAGSDRFPRDQVETTDDALTVVAFTCTDPAVIASARAFQKNSDAADLSVWLQQRLCLAVAVERAAAPAVDLAAYQERVDDLRQRFVRGTAWFADQLRTKVDEVAGVDGLLPATIERELTELSKAVEQVATGPLRDTLRSVLDQHAADLVAQVQRASAAQAAQLQALLAPDNAASPLRTFLANQERANESVVRELERLGTGLDLVRDAVAVTQAVTRERESSTAKGTTHEDIVGAALARIANAAGDDHEATGRKSGRSGTASWVGDHTISINGTTLGQRPRVVVEAKDRHQSINKWRTEAKASMDNRAAQSCLGVVRASSDVPSGATLAIVEPNIAVVRYAGPDDEDLLVAAYRFMRAQAIAEVQLRTSNADLPTVADALARSRALLERWGDIDRKVSTIRNAAAGIADTATELRSEIERELARALAALHSVTAET